MGVRGVKKEERMFCMKDCSPEEVMKKLQEPFPAEDIEWRVQRTMMAKNGAKAVVCAYVTNRAIMNRLDDVFGVSGWKNEFFAWGDNGVKCRISIKVDGEWIHKEDGAEQTNIESIKGGFSASMKRCAVQLGIGRYLYNLEECWVDIHDRKQTSQDVYINTKVRNGNQDQWIKGYWTPPSLPSWALPTKHSEKLTPQSSPSQPQPVNRAEMLNTIRQHEQKIGLVDGGYKAAVFKKATGKKSDISKASEQDLHTYYEVIRPVSDVITAANHYGVSVQDMLTIAGNVLGGQKFMTTLSLIFKVHKRNQAQIIEQLKLKGTSKRAV